MKSFDEHLRASAEQHGHLCAGQYIGVRMARMGLRELGIDEPENYRDLIVFIENDRCLADAVSSVTGCKLGRRRLKYRDYGKSAASFLDLATGKAVRISSTRWISPPENNGAHGHGGGHSGSGAAHSHNDNDGLRAFFDALTDNDLFKVERVSIALPPEDMPGKPAQKVTCARCGEIVTDKRQVEAGGETLCRSCAGNSYYTVLKE
ncbi:MAG: FmdE family protein [Spirochaetaceae bacterium]|jgi:formylmethanofuran dehydrogenase subunit E|nr:FmdE family protein [Spirochaetaceae bacterium]